MDSASAKGHVNLIAATAHHVSSQILAVLQTTAVNRVVGSCGQSAGVRATAVPGLSLEAWSSGLLEKLAYWAEHAAGLVVEHAMRPLSACSQGKRLSRLYIVTEHHLNVYCIAVLLACGHCEQRGKLCLNGPALNSLASRGCTWKTSNIP
eukprot:6181046-Pleurochrysis_carterae.AAC.5